MILNQRAVSRVPFLRWLPAPIFNGGFVAEDKEGWLLLRQSRDSTKPCMSCWVPKSWMTIKDAKTVC